MLMEENLLLTLHWLPCSEEHLLQVRPPPATLEVPLQGARSEVIVAHWS